MKSKDNYTVYRHISPSGKVYVGITCQRVSHRWANGKGYMNSVKSIFKSTIIKYGWDNLKHEILFTGLPEKRAKNLEVELIRHYKALGISLNGTDGGEGTRGVIPWNKGIKVPYEKSNKRKGVPLTEDHKKKLSIAHLNKHPKGHPWTEEQRRKLVPQLRARRMTEEAKEKIREHSARSRKVIEFDSAGNKIKEFKTATEAGLFYGIDSSRLSRCCREKRTCNGHVFLYADSLVDISEVKDGRENHYGKPVVLRNILTGEIKNFRSVTECAKFFSITKGSTIVTTIKKHLYIHSIWEPISFDGKAVGPVHKAINEPVAVRCTNVETGEEKVVASIAECARFLSLPSDDSVKRTLHGIRGSNIINGWEVTYAA